MSLFKKKHQQSKNIPTLPVPKQDPSINPYKEALLKHQRSGSMLKNEDNLVTDRKEIADCSVNYFQTLFSPNYSILQDLKMVDDTISSLVDDIMNAILTMIHSLEEIFDVVFSLNKDNAPDPNGVEAVFYLTYWNIIKQDVSNVVLQFFKFGWVFPRVNSNTVILIHKNNVADSLDKFRRIAISNFKFKIISKIRAYRLVILMPNIVT